MRTLRLRGRRGAGAGGCNRSTFVFLCVMNRPIETPCAFGGGRGIRAPPSLRGRVGKKPVFRLHCRLLDREKCGTWHRIDRVFFGNCAGGAVKCGRACRVGLRYGGLVRHTPFRGAATVGVRGFRPVLRRARMGERRRYQAAHRAWRRDRRRRSYLVRDARFRRGAWRCGMEVRSDGFRRKGMRLSGGRRRRRAFCGIRAAARYCAFPCNGAGRHRHGRCEAAVRFGASCRFFSARSPVFSSHVRLRRCIPAHGSPSMRLRASFGRGAGIRGRRALLSTGRFPSCRFLRRHTSPWPRHRACAGRARGPREGVCIPSRGRFVGYS